MVVGIESSAASAAAAIGKWLAASAANDTLAVLSSGCLSLAYLSTFAPPSQLNDRDLEISIERWMSKCVHIE